jgi:hypothetical protein
MPAKGYRVSAHHHLSGDHVSLMVFHDYLLSDGGYLMENEVYLLKDDDYLTFWKDNHT